ncbi:cation:proton antiporter [Leptolyngbya sp. AN02str]|uniref:cation:proton antiporter n=1 Tax=Leptolyngbya sp. AN02str TaxID=3423363 RepID=UPI003D31ECF0
MNKMMGVEDVWLMVSDGKAMAIAWLVLPLFAAFCGYLFSRLSRYVAFGVALVSLAYGLQLVLNADVMTLQLIDSFGVTLRLDSLSGYFILTNALVTMAVLLYCWQTNKTTFFYTQLIILHGSLNAVFACADFMSLYVALEVIGIAAFLLIAYPRTDRAIWVALRYLFVSNTAMLFYLIGAVLVYQAHHSFAFTGLQGAPTEAIALIFLGLLTKGGIFVSGLWLPLTHSESETPVSAMLSGVVVKAGVFPLVRCALLVEEVQPLLGIFSVASALLGVSYAMVEADTKRLLALSTISQLGFMLAAPAIAGFYALSHGLAKATLFLLSGALPSRNLKDLHQTRIHPVLWGAVAIASLSISGVPLLAGFGAKALALKELPSWQAIALNLSAVGTAIAFARFLFLPIALPPKLALPPGVKPGLIWAVGLLLGGLVLANGFYTEVYTVPNLAKSLAIAGAGWLVYWVILRRTLAQLPRLFEQFEHLIGVMSVMLTLLFWMVLA